MNLITKKSPLMLNRNCNLIENILPIPDSLNTPGNLLTSSLLFLFLLLLSTSGYTSSIGSESESHSSIGSIYHISPTGSGTSCSQSNPCGDFRVAFNVISGGDTLIVEDGIYNQDMGILRKRGKKVAIVSNPPSGTAANPTRIVAKNDGGALITGDLNIGNISYVDIEGFKFDPPSGVAGSIGGQHINLRKASFHLDQKNPKRGGLSIYGSHVLIEDVWVSGKGKYGFMAGSGSNRKPDVGRHITFRRVVISLKDYIESRGFLGILLYGAKDILVENMIVIDFGDLQAKGKGFKHSAGIRSRFGYGAHTHNFYGSLVLNHPFNGFLVTVGGCENCIAWDVGRAGFKQESQHSQAKGMKFNKITVGEASAGIFSYSHDYKNTLIYNSGRSKGLKGNKSVHRFNSRSASAESQDLNSDLTVKYITRVEPGSPGYRRGPNGENSGADLLYKYVNGVETSEPLWPWPFESRIRKEMCTDVGVTDGWCAPGNGLYGGERTLTSYIWEYLGTPCPSDICRYAN